MTFSIPGDAPLDWDVSPQGFRVTLEEGACPSPNSDGQHCVHWWDAEAPCCHCGFSGGDKGDE